MNSKKEKCIVCGKQIPKYKSFYTCYKCSFQLQRKPKLIQANIKPGTKIYSYWFDNLDNILERYEFVRYGHPSSVIVVQSERTLEVVLIDTNITAKRFIAET